jgi:hypothetical protein
MMLERESGERRAGRKRKCYSLMEAKGARKVGINPEQKRKGDRDHLICVPPAEGAAAAARPGPRAPTSAKNKRLYKAKRGRRVAQCPP